jgi:hypothetical protein
MELKNVILDYLQHNSLDLCKKFSLASARFEDDPPRLVLVVRNKIDVPIILHKTVNIPVVLELEEGTVIMIEKNEEVVAEKEKISDKMSEQFKTAMGIKEALGPINEKGTGTEQAYESWKKRHKHVVKAEDK